MTPCRLVLGELEGDASQTPYSTATPQQLLSPHSEALRLALWVPLKTTAFYKIEREIAALAPAARISDSVRRVLYSVRRTTDSV